MVFDKKLFDYAAAFHIHTKYSFDGNTDVEDIIRSAGKNGLKVIFITDHFRLDALKDGLEGWHDGVLVIVGEEISPRYNHYLAFDIKVPVTVGRYHDKPQEYIDQVNAQGGFGFIAHPDHSGTKAFGIKDYPWLDWSVKGYTGISVWDLMTDWQETLTSMPRAVLSYLFPAWLLKGPKKITLERWDRLNRSGMVAGYGEVDNHNSLKKYFGISFKIFPFDYAFSTIRTHIILEQEISKDLLTAKKQVYDGIKSFKSYIAQERWNKSEGFVYSVSNKQQRLYFGGEIGLDEKTKLEIMLPLKAKIKVIYNGDALAGAIADRFEITIKEPGVYRVEVYQKKFGVYKPWIYSNPVRVKA